MPSAAQRAVTGPGPPPGAARQPHKTSHNRRTAPEERRHRPTGNQQRTRTAEPPQHRARPQPPQHRNAPTWLPPPVRPRLPAGEQPIGCGAQDIAQPIAAKDPPRRRSCADTQHKPTNPEEASRARPVTRKQPVSQGFLRRAEGCGGTAGGAVRLVRARGRGHPDAWTPGPRPLPACPAPGLPPQAAPPPASPALSAEGRLRLGADCRLC